MHRKEPIVAFLEEPSPENFKEVADEYSAEEIVEYSEKFEALSSMALEYQKLQNFDRDEGPRHIHNYFVDVDDNMNIFQDSEEAYDEIMD